jgi:hypothetical protein
LEDLPKNPASVFVWDSCGLMLISDDLNTPSPAGFWLSDEISPPIAVNAPPMEVNLEVPP